MGFRSIRVVLFVLLAGMAGVARGQAPYPFHTGVWPQKISRETLAHKAIAAMAQEKFTVACIDQEGNAWGFDDKTAVAVLSFPYLDGGLHAVVLTAGRDDAEAGRLRNAIRTYLVDAPYDESAPKQLGDAGAKRPPNVPHLAWNTINRNETRLLRYFDTATSLVLEKRGLPPHPIGKALILTCVPDHSAACFATPGPNAISATIGVISACSTPEDAKRNAQTISREIVKLLYE
jgi:hypothetical protein